jgi:hypothetical protein
MTSHYIRAWGDPMIARTGAQETLVADLVAAIALTL